MPRWSLAEIYPSPDGPEFAADVAAFRSSIDSAMELIGDHELRGRDLSEWLRRILPVYDRCHDLFENLESYAYAGYSVATGDPAAQRALNTAGELSVPLSELNVTFRDALADVPDDLDGILADQPDLEGYRYVLQEERFFQSRQLSPMEESLAADLARSGADAWSRLQETLSSTLSVVWDDDTQETKSVVELRALAYDRDRGVRRRAWEKELDAWKSVETPIAFALNGVKGATNTLNTRRGWRSTLERSTRQNRLSHEALDALIGEMRSALPLFRRYLRIKARSIGVERLGFYDLFAPVGNNTTRWSYVEAIEYIRTMLADFDPDLGTFVRRLRDERWIDTDPRPGKVGGGYCIDFPVTGQSRILTNFDGTYDGMSTLAHELGHAWHSELLRDLPAGQRHYPMTLAETASIFNETLVFYRALEDITDTDAQLYILEQYLQGVTQVIVDILSRFEFESAVMERRRSHELSPDEFCRLMTEAQNATYGDALDGDSLHPYMWAVKGHYYRSELGFYNFPYAFGQLFGLGLYVTYEEEPGGFASRYRALLRETGRNDAVTVAADVGFDIESPTFWRSGLERIATLIDRFEELVGS